MEAEQVGIGLSTLGPHGVQVVADAGGTATHVLIAMMVLAHHSDLQGCWATKGTLGREIDRSEDTVYQGIRWLREHGFLTRGEKRHRLDPTEKLLGLPTDSPSVGAEPTRAQSTRAESTRTGCGQPKQITENREIPPLTPPSGGTDISIDPKAWLLSREILERIGSDPTRRLECAAAMMDRFCPGEIIHQPVEAAGREFVKSMERQAIEKKLDLQLLPQTSRAMWRTVQPEKREI